ncbi:type II restriction enzyme [Ignavigranum ruoffiae]|uniref:Type-2 restriction enzyme n=1 Tax=Ignavigranum ruoffiae TaxID=89093 RepID=A0A1H9B471_9LACT|nr:type II restriction endonuclease [Ignavigranum ruoffiae]SEP83816.1 type II restriction enzyme [Ignavigranum ruoffiae]
MNYLAYKNLDPKNKLEYFIDTLSLTNRTPEYFVNWNKVKTNTKKYELELNTLNYLIGKENIVEEAKKLFLQQPHLLKAIPSLIASRDNNLDILLIRGENMSTLNIDFNNIDIKNIDIYLRFIEESGLFTFLKNDANRSLVDYVYGVETGLDSNARKNRSGTTMEGILTKTLVGISERLKWEHYEQATSSYMLDKWNINVPVDKSARRFDGALMDHINNKAFVFETNYYGGGGSKLKAVCGEFQTLNELINNSKDNVRFIWITDGQGWKTAKFPMEEAMGQIENIFNLKMVKDGFLYELLIQEEK